jgi:hypothetical protein
VQHTLKRSTEMEMPGFRTDLTHLDSYAIDDRRTIECDDAISLVGFVLFLFCFHIFLFCSCLGGIRAHTQSLQVRCTHSSHCTRWHHLPYLTSTPTGAPTNRRHADTNWRGEYSRIHDIHTQHAYPTHTHTHTHTHTQTYTHTP